MRPLKSSISLIVFTVMVSLPGLGRSTILRAACGQPVSSRNRYGPQSFKPLSDLAAARSTQQRPCLFLPLLHAQRQGECPLAWLEQAAKLRLPDAQLLMGANYEVGLNFQQDFEQAMFWYREAANQDFPYAQYELASIYFEGRAGQTRNVKEALFWGQLAARHQFHSVVELIEKSKTQLNREDIQAVERQVSKWVARRIRQTGKS
jgi:hypothetical protein